MKVRTIRGLVVVMLAALTVVGCGSAHSDRTALLGHVGDRRSRW
jgi:hypothetical protein